MTSLKKNNYLITGGLGFIGSNIAKLLIKRKNVQKCILVDNFGGYINPLRWTYQDFRKLRFTDIKDKKLILLIKKKCVFERGDCSDFKTMYSILEKYKPKIIFHTAAVPVAKIQNPNISEFRRGSVDTTINLLDCVDLLQKKNKFKLSRFLYISSSMVYGDFKKKQVKETDILNPRDIYGTMKLAGEVIVKGLSKYCEIPYTIIRPSAVYGPTDMNERVTQFLLMKAFNKDELLEIHGKDEKLDFTYIEDMANGCVKAATKKQGLNNTFNITFGKGRTILSYAKIIGKYFKNSKYKVIKRNKASPKRGTLSISKAKKLLDYKPKYSLERGTAKYIEFLKHIDLKLKGAAKFPKN